ncbi:uncharacterized protein LOC121854288 [Homarus americanus]|uniref:Putative Lytic polysaccharide mono-oxygenase, cellulose-degrading-containing protein 5 n=1 Tax=Homarus americanus TaxID=6706 RepID=A0A8J5JDQ0_HOMAM|nr:uncharacterized protein LOC121854288 [Homarus americanus]KAG7155940.1 putative Lytic polysaccharide mono-oxygenase, cellulose-degrading-containing protein 5 [Homarus americanus]
MSYLWVLNVGLLVLWVAGGVDSHGRLMEPVCRSSAWRKGFNTPINYDDNQLYCGGFGVQYKQNDGKCGVCGDNWADPQPRDNEAGGTYGTGLIVANYTRGQDLTVEVNLTRNHLGYFEFSLCVNNDVTKIITQECLDEHLLEHADGSGTKAYIYADDPEWHKTTVKLPDDVVCTQCVLQWHYHTANSWGDCGNGTQALGCGNQEIFRGCADIGIY